MARPRKRHVQQRLFRRGGKQPGAGRPPRGPRSSERHKVRPKLRASHPVHVVIRAARDLGSLRRRDMFRAIREATIVVAARDDFRIVHLSIQGTHVHMLVEADDRLALARGMQGFQISAAKHINRMASKRRIVRRKGRVFVDRYHATIVDSPRQARHALAYVLNNWRRHREDRAPFARRWLVDPFSSAVSFGGWNELAGAMWMWQPPTYQPLIVWLPRTWLLREGWRRAGSICARDVPGPLAASAGRRSDAPVPPRRAAR
jgi:REP element-mobilizing transposase RayT